MGKDEQNETRGLDPYLAERLAQPLPFAGGAGAGSLAARVLDPPEGAPPVPIALDGLLFREAGALRLAVIVKATFSLTTPTMIPAEAADPVRSTDAHYQNRPLGHVIAASDRVPRKPRVDVTLLGHARAPRGEAVPEMKARLVLLQGSRAIDKTVRVVGPRSAADAAPEPFVTMPLTWERAHGGSGTPANPIGCGVDDDDQPNVLDPENPWRPVGFGPISSAWPLRNKRLGPLPRRALDAPVVELPPGFDWGFFQSAPADQQLDELDPEAIVVLEGFDAGRPRLEIALPDARARGAIYGLDPASADAPTPLDFRADTLQLDADRWTATITFRASVALGDDAELGRLLVAVGVSAGEREQPVPAARPEAGRASAPGPAPSARTEGGARSEPSGTLELPVPAAPSPLTLPFGKAEAPGRPGDTLLLPSEADALPRAAPAADPLAKVQAPTVPFPVSAPTILFPPAEIGGALPARPPEGSGRKASDFFHDISRLPAPDGTVPRAKDEAPARDAAPTLGLEDYATIAAELAEPGARRAQVLAAHELDGPAFRLADRHYRRALEREGKRGERALRERFDDAYVRSWEARHPEGFGVAGYARLQRAQQRGLLVGELEALGIEVSLGVRLRRVWRRRIAGDEQLRGELERALAAPAEAVPG